MDGRGRLGRVSLTVEVALEEESETLRSPELGKGASPAGEIWQECSSWDAQSETISISLNNDGLDDEFDENWFFGGELTSDPSIFSGPIK